MNRRLAILTGLFGLTTPFLKAEVIGVEKSAPSSFDKFKEFCKLIKTRSGESYEFYPYFERIFYALENNRFNILKKFRQGGFTTFLIVYETWKCLTTQNYHVLHMSRFDRCACKCGEIVDRILESLPKEHNINFTKHEKKFKDTNSSICFYTPKAARGRSADSIVIDEAAFIGNMHSEFKAMAPVISSGGRLTAVSTVNGKGNWFHETYTQDNEFNKIEVSHMEHPVYSKKEWLEIVKLNLGHKAFRQEVLCEFLEVANSPW